MEESKELLKQARSRLGLTQAEMAGHLRVKQNTISQYEAGKAEPSIEVLMRASRLVEHHADLHQAIAQRIASRVRALTAEETDSLPIIISDDDQPFDYLVGRIIAELKNAQSAPGVVKILQLYRRTQNSLDMWPVFTKAAGYIEVEIARRTQPADSASDQPRSGKRRLSPRQHR